MLWNAVGYDGTKTETILCSYFSLLPFCRLAWSCCDLVWFRAALAFAESLRDPVTFKEMTKKACRDPADTFY
jgi:hypothetical protein